MSPRNKRIRRVGSPPVFKGFKPIGHPAKKTNIISILYEEYEAFRLIDYSELSQEEASKIMNVSRPTFTRIYNSALKKIAKAFAEGSRMHIEGGNVVFDKEWYRCLDCVSVFHHDNDKQKECISCESDNIEHINKSIENWKDGLNRGGTSSSRPIGINAKKQSKSGDGNRGMPDIDVFCICSKCKYEELHTRGVPCFTKTCPNCNSPLIRKGKEN